MPRGAHSNGDLLEAQQREQREAQVACSAHVGGPIARFPLTFSGDDKLLLCPSGDAVKLYAVATGERVGELRGHTAAVTCVARNPADPLQAYTASLDGTVRCWDVAARACVRTWSAGSPVLHMCVPPPPQQQQMQQPPREAPAAGPAPGRVYLNVNPKVLRGDGKGACRVVRLDLDDEGGRVTVLHKARSCSAIAVSPRGDYVVSVSNRTLSCWSVRRQELVKHRHSRALTTVAFHPTDPFLATGDDRGQIVLWHNFVHSDTSKVVNSTLHWHAHAVTALGFTDDGAYMMSGGEEAVLVLWQLQSEHRQFLPRLGAPIVGIEVSPSGRRYALRCGDNAVRVVDAITSRAERVIRGLQAHGSGGAAAAAAVQVAGAGAGAGAAAPGGGASSQLLMRPAADPRGDLLVLPAGPGSLQFYDVFGDRHVRDHEVIPRNFVSRMDGERALPTRVERVAFSRDGAWMATVERRSAPADGGHRSTALKLWRMDRGRQGGYSLNTRVNDPHDGDVSALEFHPSGRLLLTASSDSRFKLWRATEATAEQTLAQAASSRGSRRRARAADAGETRHSWGCQSVGTYRSFGAQDACFSHDGSLMAVVYGQLVTLWEPHTMELRHTLVYPGPEEPVVRALFCRGSPHLVAATASAVYVWNLLTLTLWWSYSIPVAGVAADPRSSRFAVAVRHNQRRGDDGDDPPAPVPYVLEFEPASATPVRVLEASDMLLPRGRGAPLAYVPRRSREAADAVSSLAYVASDGSIVRVDPEAAGGEDSEEEEEEEEEEGEDRAEAARSSFTGLFGASATVARERAAVSRNDDVGAVRVAGVDELFAGPTHAAPSLDAAFDSLVRSVVTERRPEANGTTPASANEGAGPRAAPRAAGARAPRARPAAEAKVAEPWDAERDARVVGGAVEGGFAASLLKRPRGAAAAAWSDSDSEAEQEEEEGEEEEKKKEERPRQKKRRTSAASGANKAAAKKAQQAPSSPSPRRTRARRKQK